MLGGQIKQRVVHGKLNSGFLIPGRIHKYRQKCKENSVQLKQEGVIDGLPLKPCHRAIPPDWENHYKILIKVVKKQVGVSSVVFLSVEED
jgi:hypothetical protein